MALPCHLYFVRDTVLAALLFRTAYMWVANVACRMFQVRPVNLSAVSARVYDCCQVVITTNSCTGRASGLTVTNNIYMCVYFYDAFKHCSATLANRTDRNERSRHGRK